MQAVSVHLLSGEKMTITVFPTRYATWSTSALMAEMKRLALGERRADSDSRLIAIEQELEGRKWSGRRAA